MQLNLFAAEVECTDQEGVTRNTIAYRSFHAFLAILLTLSMTGVLRAQPQTAKVIVNINGVRNATGRVEVRLWNGKDGFPKDDTKAFRRTTVRIVNGTASTTFTDLPPGTYAVSAFHDENGNGKMDTRFPGIPVEGVGVSNDPHKRFGPPAFDACKFTLSGAETTIPIVVDY